MVLQWFLLSFYCTKALHPPPLRTDGAARAGVQGTANVNSKGQQRLWRVQWHIPGIILQKRSSDWVQKEFSFLESEPCNPAVTVNCTEEREQEFSVPNLQSSLQLGWVTQLPPAGRKEQLNSSGFIPTGQQWQLWVGWGRRLDTDRAGKATMDWETLRATCSEVFGDRTLTWQPPTTEGKLYEVLCLWKQGHTHFINHY